MHSEDLNFVYNSEAQGQWDPVVLQNRRGKPCYTFNRVLQPINMVVADMRQTRPAGKVRPASDGASEPVADIYGGLCRSIEQCSRAEAIYKEQFKYAVAGGFGAWRIIAHVHAGRRRRRVRSGAAPDQHLEPADRGVGPAVRGRVRRRRQPVHRRGAHRGRDVRRPVQGRRRTELPDLARQLRLVHGQGSAHRGVLRAHPAREEDREDDRRHGAGLRRRPQGAGSALRRARDHRRLARRDARRHGQDTARR